MSYKDLQKEAKMLGLKYVGVSASKLKKTIKQATPEVPTKSPKVEIPETNKNVNAAIVRDESNEVRRYTVDVHGKDFAKLAEEFAKARDYVVELVEVKPSIKCPDCGATINI